MVRRVIDRFWAVVQDEGITAAIAKIGAVPRRAFRRTEADVFDADFKTATSVEVPLWRLRIPSENAKFGSKYRAVDSSFFLAAMSTLPVNCQDFTFVDLGCGKGRTLILAAQQGMKKIVGVEFSPELAAAARKNSDLVGVHADVVEMDACNFTFPDDDQIVFMYNPFGERVMNSVVGNLLKWRGQSRKQAFVVYANPVCQQIFDSTPRFEPVVKKDGLRIWRMN